jgi:outer membrane protein TolC
VQYKLARLTALVSLSKALGGGWTQASTTNSEPPQVTWNRSR